MRLKSKKAKPKPRRFDERQARRRARRREESALGIARADRDRMSVGLPPDGSA